MLYEVITEYTGADAIMIGRAAQGQPWLFRRIRHYLEQGSDLPEPDRITSYNVCYTKLLRSLTAFICRSEC